METMIMWWKESKPSKVHVADESKNLHVTLCGKYFGDAEEKQLIRHGYPSCKSCANSAK